MMKVLVLFSFFALVLADENGQYVPDNSGQYIPDYSGQYIPDGSGRYLDDGTGRYAGDNSGIYSGQKDFIEKYRGFGGNGGNLIGSATSNNQVFQPLKQVRSPTPVPAPTPKPQPQPQPQPYRNSNLVDGKWKIIRQLSDIDTDGYHWEYETENKITAEESGKLHNVGTDAEAIRAKGFFQYTGPDNVVYSITYTADENGFIPVGDHLPTPPPIPAAIVKALEFNKANERNKV